MPFKTANQVGEEMLAAPKAPMSNDVSRAFLNLTLMETQATNVEAVDTLRPLFDCFAYKVCDQRAQVHRVPINAYVKLLIVSLAQSPGDIMLYLTAMKALSRKFDNAQVTMSLIAMRGFPVGFPTEKARHKIWDDQKDSNSPNDNSVDSERAWL